MVKGQKKGRLFVVQSMSIADLSPSLPIPTLGSLHTSSGTNYVYKNIYSLAYNEGERVLLTIHYKQKAAFSSTFSATPKILSATPDYEVPKPC